ncbi:hypothetical protein WEI85_39730 [Actinomycetes bacterium KLBMP 9797]
MERVVRQFGAVSLQAGRWAVREARRAPHVLAIAATALAAVVIVAMALRASTAATDRPAADQPYYGSTEALESSAALIVRGTILRSTERRDNGYPETIATVSVAKVAKGEAGRRIEVGYVTPGSGPEAPIGLTVGEEYVFLLVPRPDEPASLVNTAQGYFAVSGGRAVAGEGSPVGLSLAVKRALNVQ